MSISDEFMSQAFALPAIERFELAQQLLESIDESEAMQVDQEFIAELDRRHEEMVHGEEVITDWRGALAEISAALKKEKQT
jgi:putative addiction module component (TIGR02574 family)